MGGKRIRYLVDRPWGDGGLYVRAWKEGRSEIVVQVWHKNDCEGEPDGDWAMPSVLGPVTCIEQAIKQTKLDAESPDTGREAE